MDFGLRWRATAAVLISLPAAAARCQERPAATGAKSGIEWVNIPGGTFVMGSGGDLEAAPVHGVKIKPFQITKTLVTNKQYRMCMKAGVCTPSRDYGAAFGGDEQPVVGVSWSQAAAFSKWAGGRLPSEAEWEYAARSGGKDYPYPWGNGPMGCGRAVVAGCGYRATAPVCSKPSGNTGQGLCDMGGNASEWVEDRYHGSYAGAPTDGSAWRDSGSLRILRGASWRNPADQERSTIRFYNVSGLRSDAVSFRPVRGGLKRGPGRLSSHRATRRASSRD